MHTVHHPLTTETKSGVIAAAVGIMFSVNDYTAKKLTWAEQRVIDNFFESLQMDTTGSKPIVDQAAYGDLMKMVDFSNRWVYKGSVTTPPCDKLVYWNVLSTVYPISRKHLDQFRNTMRVGGSHRYYISTGTCVPTGGRSITGTDTSTSTVSSNEGC